MTRGQASKPGEVRIAANGYHYTRTQDGWRLTHHIVAEAALGRKLQHDERVTFKDGDKKNLKASNLKVSKKGEASKAQQRARIQARIDELQAQLVALN